MKELRNKNDFDNSWTAPNTEVVWEVDANPKRAGFKAAMRFDQYFGSQTVAEYLDSGGTKADLRYDWEHKFLDLKVESEIDEADPADSEAEVIEASPEGAESDDTDTALIEALSDDAESDDTDTALIEALSDDADAEEILG